MSGGSVSAGSSDSAGGQKSSSGRSPFSAPFSSPWFIASVVFVVVVLALGAWVVGGRVVSGGRAGGNSPAPSATPPPASASAAGTGAASAGSDPAASACGLAAGDQQVPVQAPVGRTHTIAPGLGIPVVDGVGPADMRSGGISQCFAHSPTGAVLGAVNWVKWFSSEQRLPEVITTLMAEGQDRDRLARLVDDGWDGSTSSPVEVRGFKVDVRSADEVVVTLAVRTGRSADEGLVSWPVLLRWEKGDWKVVAPASNAWGQEPVDSVAQGGFTEWSV